jgi:AraC family transcriptional regulator
MRAVVAIERDLDASVSLPELAEHACLSPFHFHRLFTAVVGEPPAEYVRRLRLERAAHELATSRRPVADIGREAGYGSQSAFTRAFSERFGRAPGEFRERERGRWAAPVVEQRKLVGRIETIGPLRVAFIRHVGPYDQVHPVFERLALWAATRGSNIEPLILGIAHDDPRITPPAQLRFDCCLEIAANVRGEGDVGVTEVGGGEYATAIHHGPFDRLAETYAWLTLDFMPRERRSMRSAPCVEIYLTSPERTSPADLLTEVLVPVRPPLSAGEASEEMAARGHMER